MSKDVQTSLLKFISTLSAKGKQREYVDASTPQSRPQYRKPRQLQPSPSASPSPSTKRKRNLSLLDTDSPLIKCRNINMSTQPNPTAKKLSLEMQSLKEEISTEMHNLIAPLKASLDVLLEMKSTWEIGLKECQSARNQNLELKQRIDSVERENIWLNLKVQTLEDKLLEGNIVFQGVPESLWEASETTKEKILNAISHTISGDNHEDKLQQAHQIPIKDVSRIGRYAPMKTRPVLVEFYHKSDAEFLLGNRTHLPQGVYIDCQYSDETEKERHKLRPILRTARNNKNYKGRCKMEGPKLVIKGKKYDSSNLHLLPDDINGFRATSKVDTDENVLGFFGELNPLSNFHPVNFNINGVSYHSSEQYIQHQKSVMFGDKSAEQMILLSNSALG